MFETVRELMAAKQITTGSVEYLKAQDEFGRATQNDHREFFASLAREDRKTALWVAFNVLAYETAESILEVAVIEPAKERFDEYMAELEMEAADRQFENSRQAWAEVSEQKILLMKLSHKLSDEREAFEGYKKSFYRKLAKVRKTAKMAQDRADRLQSQVREMTAKAKKNSETVRMANRMADAMASLFASRMDE